MANPIDDKGWSYLGRWLRVDFRYSNDAAVPDGPPEVYVEPFTPTFVFPGEHICLAPNAPAQRKRIGKCIYCGADELAPGTGDKLTEEHVISEGMGARFILTEASCEECRRRTNRYERQILNSIFWTPRRQLKIRGKKRKRQETLYPITVTSRTDTEIIYLPLEHHPTMLFLPSFNAPGILIGRPNDRHGVQGAWVIELNKPDHMFARGEHRFATPALDTMMFCQMLAKIAHGYAVSLFGLGGFEPSLPSLIRYQFGDLEFRPDCYEFIGGDPTSYAPGNELHALGWGTYNVNGTTYLVVIIRLFSSLSAPVYQVVVGTPSSSLRLRQAAAVEAPL